MMGVVEEGHSGTRYGTNIYSLQAGNLFHYNKLVVNIHCPDKVCMEEVINEVESKGSKVRKIGFHSGDTSCLI